MGMQRAWSGAVSGKRCNLYRYHLSAAEMRNIYRIVEMCSRWLLGVVFLYGGIPKLFQINDFAENIGAFGIVPDAILLPVALVIVMLEVVVGFGLLARKMMAQHLAGAMLAVFIGVLSYGIWLGLDIDCGCFAGEGNEHGSFSSLKHALIRDLFLLLPLLFLYYQPVLNKTLLKEYKIEKA